MATTYTKEQIEKLIDGRLDWDTVFRMLAMPKDPERFELYVGVLQERLGWKDKIILPLGRISTSCRPPQTSAG